jgi:acyl-CoA reductase-like NAD-dependent aldehyde dehydrogenase
MSAKKTDSKTVKGQSAANANAVTKKRIEVRKTYKLFMDGKFPRSESGRVYPVLDAAGLLIANACRASRKDLRDSIVSNRKAFPGWSSRSAYNKGQILYRIAETLEDRRAQFTALMVRQGFSAVQAEKEVTAAADLLVHYAGWTDKYIQLFSAVNPVESSHFNFSYPEPLGVVTLVAPASSALLGWVAMLAPVLAGGNVCTVLAADKYALTAVDFSEVLHASDVPAGVVNILTGFRKELIGHASSHMDVNGVGFADLTQEERKQAETNAALNVKRVLDFSEAQRPSPYHIMAAQEIKTTWHPVGA